MTRQCAVLVGGLGSRLGVLTKAIPKPLLPVNGKPFLETLLRELARRGFNDVVLCAGHRANSITDYVTQSRIAEVLSIRIRVSIEPQPLGTAGALKNAARYLADEFVVLNGDTWFDFNWLDIIWRARTTNCSAAIALKRTDNASRYETVVLNGQKVVAFQARRESTSARLINGGVYWLRKPTLNGLKPKASLEFELLPRLAEAGELAGWLYDGFFIDIGVPESYAAAQSLVPNHTRRPAVFFDRDGVLNQNTGYVHRSADFVWMPAAKAAIKAVNDLGYYVFVVTNQAGVGHGYYTLEDVNELHRQIDDELCVEGAYIDDWRFCPYHPSAKLTEFRCSHEWRKPAPGMILDLLKTWPVDKTKSFLIGDKESDLAAARAAGIDCHKYTDGNLETFVRKIVDLASG